VVGGTPIVAGIRNKLDPPTKSVTGHATEPSITDRISAGANQGVDWLKTNVSDHPYIAGGIGAGVLGLGALLASRKKKDEVEE
jgi:LPXTG-motif cell wall-anchored protein